MINQPYIGLRPFERNETDIFFGRETHTDELIDRLGARHFLAVVGTSGCGKSSLVKTGLIAGLEAGYLAKASTHWRIVEMRPSNQPFQALAAQLFSELNDVLAAHYTVDTLRDTLKQGSLSLHELLAQHPLPNNAQLLIVCDQFEEIFRYFQQGASAEARNFVSLLLASSKPYPVSTTQLSNSVYVVITMRSDFLGDCAQFAGLAEAINQGLYLTPRLNAQQLRAAIEEPAFVFDGDIEPALITQLLEDAQTNQDQLPVLQHALMIMWRLAEKAGKLRLTLQHYQQIGGLKNALSNHADRVFDELSSEQQRIAELLFRSLTERGDAQRDTRRPTRLTDIIEHTASSFAEVVAVIDKFRQTDRCFLMPPINVVLTADSIIDISHESLIRQWQRLKDWTADEADSAKTYQRLEDRAIEWKKHKAGLLQSPELEIFQQWWQEKYPTLLWAERYGEKFSLITGFLTASHAEHYQRLQNAEQQLQAISDLTYDLIDELMGCIGTLPAIKKIIQTNLSLLSLLEKIDTPQAIREKSVNLNKLAEVHLKLGDKQKALKLSKQALEISKQLAKQDLQNNQAQRDLSVSHQRLALVYLGLGDKGKTLEHYQKTLKIREQIARKDSQDSKAQQDLLGIFQVLSLYFYEHKNYIEAAKIYVRALAKFPNDLTFLSNDMELALVQNDDLRFQQRLKSLSPLLKTDKPHYAVIPFLSYLAQPQQGYQAVIKAIEKLDKGIIKADWNFSDIQPAIKRQNQKTQQIVQLFIDYFEQRLDLKALKTKLAELETK